MTFNATTGLWAAAGAFGGAIVGAGVARAFARRHQGAGGAIGLLGGAFLAAAMASPPAPAAATTSTGTAGLPTLGASRGVVNGQLAPRVR